MRGGMFKPFRQNDEGDLWRFLAVDVDEISPRFYKPLQAEKMNKCHQFLKKIIRYLHFTIKLFH